MKTHHACWRQGMRSVLVAALFVAAALPAAPQASPPRPDAQLIERIDAFVAHEVKSSGLPGVAIAVLQEGQAPHLRGFGNDGRGHAITADTPFPIGSLTKSFTALLVHQLIDTGQLDADAPLQRYLPWFRVADADASARITLRHLLNQTSGFSRADGIAPLLRHDTSSVDDLARGLAGVSLNRPVGERFEYSNLNYIVLGALLQAVSGRTWQDLVRERVLQPLGMAHSHTDVSSARQAGMTTLHRIWFGIPVQENLQMLPGVLPTGGLVASAGDMARYLDMLLDSGAAPSGRILSPQGVTQLLAPASPPAHTRLLSADFDFRYGEGWFVGPFGAAADARWHLGSLTSFAAWMVLLPDTKQAVAVLINANTELPINQVNAVMSRLPIGVVNLLRGQSPPQGPSLRSAYLPFNGICALALTMLAAIAWCAARARKAWTAVLMALAAAALVGALYANGLSPTMLAAFAPDLAIVLAAVAVALCLPLAWHLMRRFLLRSARP
jgi:CubicO group peptidase (beta-lactamase class C family)